jgi:PAS domain S-box-containing protein
VKALIDKRDLLAVLAGLLVATLGVAGIVGHTLGAHVLIRPFGLGPEPSIAAAAAFVTLGLATALMLGGRRARGAACAFAAIVAVYAVVAAYLHAAHLFSVGHPAGAPWGLEVGSAVCIAAQAAAVAVTAVRPKLRAPLAVASTLTLGLASTSLLAYSIGVELLRRYGVEMPFLISIALLLHATAMLAWAWYGDVAETGAPMPAWSPLVAAMSSATLFVGFMITVEGNAELLQVLLVLGAAGKLGSTVHERLRERREDVAARHAAHAAQRRAEVRTDEAVAQRRWLETILDLAPVPLVMLDPRTARLTFANEAADALAGGRYPADAGPASIVYLDARGRPLPEADTPPSRIVRGERLESVEVVALTPSGRHELIVDGAMLPAMEGQPRIAVLAFQDITRLRRAEEEMGRLGRIVDDAPTEVYAFDATTLRLVQENAAARRNLGYRSDELKQMTVLDLSPSHTMEEVSQLLEPLRTGEASVVTIETTQVRKDGTVYPVEARIQLSRAEAAPVFVSLVHNISERKRTEAERARLLTRERRARADADASRERLSFIAAASRALVEPHDLEGTLRAVVRTAVPRLARWSVLYLAEEDGSMRRASVAAADDAGLAETIARDVPTRAPSGAAVSDAADPTLARALSAAELDETLALSSDAARAAVRELGTAAALTIPLRGRGTTLGELVLVEAKDPARWSAPAERGLVEEYAARAALAIHDARLHEDAKEALHARDEFLVVASHDLRMPLSLLEMQVESMQRVVQRAGLDGVPSGRLSRFLEGVLRLARQLSIVVEDVLDPSRLTGTQMQLALEEIDLAGVVCTTVARFGDQLAHAGSRVVLSATETAPGEWDRFRLEQVVGNLLSNALDSGAGKPIEVSVDSDDDFARLHVRDHGATLTEERKSQLFSLAVRAVSARHYGGAGLGLFLVRRIVEALHGTIEVKTHAGDGTSFTVTLPRRQHHAEAAA